MGPGVVAIVARQYGERGTKDAKARAMLRERGQLAYPICAAWIRRAAGVEFHDIPDFGNTR